MKIGKELFEENQKKFEEHCRKDVEIFENAFRIKDKIMKLKTTDFNDHGVALVKTYSSSNPTDKTNFKKVLTLYNTLKEQKNISRDFSNIIGLNTGNVIFTMDHCYVGVSISIYYKHPEMIKGE